MSQSVENHKDTQSDDQPSSLPTYEDDQDTDDDNYEYENIFQDPMVEKVRDELNQRIKSFDEDLKQLDFVLAMIKERRKKYKDIIFSKNDEDIVKNFYSETKEKLDSAKKRLNDFNALMETKVKALDFAINQRWMDLQYIEKSTEGLFDRVPKLKDHFYDTQEMMEKEADGILSALHEYIKHMSIADDRHDASSTKLPKVSNHRKFSPAKVNSLLEEMIRE